MPTPGLSLVGFMTDQLQAINHLRTPCIPKPSARSDAELVADWQAARGKIGRPVANAGRPQLRPIDDTHPHIQQVLFASPLAPALAPLLAAGATFQMVEIAPLLAYQFTVDTARSGNHCKTLSKPPTEDEVFNCCLPLLPHSDPIHISQQGLPRVGQSVVIKSRSLNLQMTAEGPMPIPNAFGIQFNWEACVSHKKAARAGAASNFFLGGGADGATASAFPNPIACAHARARQLTIGRRQQ
jgi:hypothetical protein